MPDNADFDNFCRKCSYYEFNLSKGVLCGLTHAKPDFADVCPDFVMAPNQKTKAETQAIIEQQKGNQNMLIGGISAVVISVIWFGAGYAAGYIFFYPPVLFIAGLIAIFKSVAGLQEDSQE